MNDDAALRQEVAEKERQLTVLDAELVRLRTAARFNRPHLVLALSLLLLVVAFAARSWLSRRPPPVAHKPACAGNR